MEHNHRAYLWAAARGRDMGIAFDEELLYVAAMLHDIGLVTAFDNATVSFDEAGGKRGVDVRGGRRLAAGASSSGLSEIIVRHMWDSVDPAFDAEGHLLEVGTAHRHLRPRPLALGARAAGRGPPRRTRGWTSSRRVHRLLRGPGAAQARQLRRGRGAQRDRDADGGQRARHG